MRSSSISLSTMAGFFLCMAVHAADDATTPATSGDSQELKDVKADAALAKSKLELAQSEIDLLKLKFGTIDTTNLPKGNATATDLELEGKLRAYAAASASIGAIAVAVQTALNGMHVVLATDAQLQSLNQYRSFLAQIEELKTRSTEVLNARQPELKPLCKAHVKFDMVAPVVGIAAINSMVSIAALFKVDVDLKGKSFDLNEFAISTLMLGALNTLKVQTIYPGAYYVLPPKAAEGEAMKEWKALYAFKKQLNDKSDAFSKAYEAITVPEKPDDACKHEIAALKTQVDAYLTGLAAAGKSIDEVGATLTKQDAQSGLTLLSTYLVSERVEKAIGQAPVLQLKAIAAGGTTQTRKNLFNTKVAFGGGAILSYQLFAQDGTILLADTVPWNAGFIDAKNFKAGRVAFPTVPPKSAHGASTTATTPPP